ncbi:hypothetical protein TL16_g12254 [Triparma laevis f. inornata]|uniref:WDHD1/CFT4 second beta-propeller domain-containing protein n=1 Tax=Triparma laevis f. inornata TaxID=1714386 RepID=A0A9W7BRF1_9STRA|nr:hypothetical protein TL16_g12254 [Triparma laevis f. inornata]
MSTSSPHSTLTPPLTIYADFSRQIGGRLAVSTGKGTESQVWILVLRPDHDDAMAMTEDIVMSQNDSSSSSSSSKTPLPFKVTATYPGPRLTSTCTSLAYSSTLECLFIGSCNSGVNLLPLPPTGSTEDADLTADPAIISFATDTSHLTNSGTTHLNTYTFNGKSFLFVYTSDHRLHVVAVVKDSDLNDYEVKRVHLTEDTVGTIVAKDTEGAHDQNRLLKVNACELGVTVPSNDSVLGLLYSDGKFESVKIEKENGSFDTKVEVVDGKMVAKVDNVWYNLSERLTLGEGEVKDLLNKPTTTATATKKTVEDDDDDIFETIHEEAEEDKTDKTEEVNKKTIEDGEDEEPNASQESVDLDAATYSDEEPDAEEKKDDDAKPVTMDTSAAIAAFKESLTRAPFQSGSTPISFDADTALPLPRLLQWNHIGALTSTPSGRQTSYDVTFNNSGLRRGHTFSRAESFIVGSIGEEGCLMATDVEDEMEEIEEEVEQQLSGVTGVSDKVREQMKRDKREQMARERSNSSKGSTIFYNRFQTFGPSSTKDWTLSLPQSERVVGCATGTGWSAVLTTNNFLRTFTSSGIQGKITWLSGSPVSITGRGNMCAVVTRKNGANNVEIYDMSEGVELVNSAKCPMDKITWMGFDDVKTLNVYDEEGYLSAMSGGDWSPVLDTLPLRKSREDSMWPVSVQSNKFVAVLLKGGNEHPEVLQRPIPSNFTLRVPVARTSDVVMEEVYIRGSMSMKNIEKEEDAYEEMSQGLDKLCLRIFQSSLAVNKVERCYDAAKRMKSAAALDIALKLCDQADLARGVRQGLVDRVNHLKTLLEEEEEEEEVEEEEEEVEEEEEEEEEEIIPRSSQKRKAVEDVDQDENVTPKDTVSPPSGTSASAAVVTGSKPSNPFTKKHFSPAKKARNTIGNILSPSPNKLARSSTFSENARDKKRTKKRII